MQIQGPTTLQHEKHVADWISDNLKAYSNMHCVNYWRRLKIVQTEEPALLNLLSFLSSNCEIEIKQYGNDFKFVLCETTHERA